MFKAITSPNCRKILHKSKKKEKMRQITATTTANENKTRLIIDAKWLSAFTISVPNCVYLYVIKPE
jgi:hypothetical protein